MVLELAADAEMVASLSRLKALTACRDGRPRTQSVKIVWHDSPEHALLADGLTLAEQRGVRRLERVYPGVDTWRPSRHLRPSKGGGRPACTSLAISPSW
jgi:hypothetical protein